MQYKQMSAQEVAENFSEVIQGIGRTKRPIVVDAPNGAVAIVPWRILEIHLEERARFFEEWRQAAERANLTPEEADEIVSQAIAEVRAEKRLRRAS